MPPKKKKGGKGKKGKKGKSSAKSATSGVGDVDKPLAQETRESYLVQIRDLESRIAKYQKKCDMLELLNKAMTDREESNSREKADTVKYLKTTLEQRIDEIADLNDRITGLQQAKDAEKEGYEMQLQQLRNELQETKDLLTSENLILSGKLASLEEFRVQREELMQRLSGLEQQIKGQEETHRAEIYELERRAVIDKDRLKKEVVVRVNQVAAEFRKLSNKQMAETTKRTIRENVSVNAQLQKMSEKTVEIIQENDELRGRDKQQRQQLEALEDTEHLLAKKNASSQKLIRMLIDKCRQQEAIIGELERQQVELGLVRDQQNSDLTLFEKLKLEVQEKKDENTRLEDLLASLRLQTEAAEQRVSDSRRLQTELQAILSDAVIAIKKMLKRGDADLELPPTSTEASMRQFGSAGWPESASEMDAGSGSGFTSEEARVPLPPLSGQSPAATLRPPPRLEQESEVSALEAAQRRDRFLERLLVILNSAALLGLGPDVREFAVMARSRSAMAARQGKGDVHTTAIGEFPGARSMQALRKLTQTLNPLTPIKGLMPAQSELEDLGEEGEGMGVGKGQHYRLGDMGIVPRTDRRIPTTLEKMRDLSKTTRYKLSEITN